MLGLLLSESEKDQIILIVIHTSPNLGNIFYVPLRYSKIISRAIFGILTLYIFYIAVTPAAYILCLTVLQIWCHSYKKRPPFWLPMIQARRQLLFYRGATRVNSFSKVGPQNLQASSPIEFKSCKLC